jgi:hypothetical protein
VTLSQLSVFHITNTTLLSYVLLLIPCHHCMALPLAAGGEIMEIRRVARNWAGCWEKLDRANFLSIWAYYQLVKKTLLHEFNIFYTSSTLFFNRFPWQSFICIYMFRIWQNELSIANVSNLRGELIMRSHSVFMLPLVCSPWLSDLSAPLYSIPNFYTPDLQHN